jgi:putative transposase
MARLPRFVLPGHPQHIIQRGNNRQPIFCCDADYCFFREKLTAACIQHGCAVHAYVLMTNHVHLLVTPQTEHAISKAMQSVGRYYVQYFNYTYQRTGTLWEGRYRATLLDTDQYLLTCYRYIELNPVRAGMVEDPADYLWSSYGFNAQRRPDPLVVPHALYQDLGRDPQERQAAYRALFQGQLDEGALAEIREATNKAWLLGNERFRGAIEQKLNRRAAPRPRGGDRRSRSYWERAE